MYDTKILAFNETEWRPDAWLAFLMTGLPAKSNALPTMVPRIDPNSLVLTQAKSLKKHAKAVAREAQGLDHKTKGAGSLVDLTDAKVKSVKHYHYIKPTATLDASSHLKRKMELIEKVISTLDPDYVEEIKEYKKKLSNVVKEALFELEKDDEKILNRPIVTASNSELTNISNLSIIDHVHDVDYDDDGEAWV